jgi:hypothetical protein
MRGLRLVFLFSACLTFCYNRANFGDATSESFDSYRDPNQNSGRHGLCLISMITGECLTQALDSDSEPSHWQVRVKGQSHQYLVRLTRYTF